MHDAINLLLSRHSYKPNDIAADGPGPTASECDMILTAAARVPDHGKLAPWRFIVFEGDARAAAGEKLAAVFKQTRPDATDQQIAFEARRFLQVPLVIAVVSKTAAHPKIPEFEQLLSSAASAMNILLASHALGYGASWLTDWIAYDAAAANALGLAAHERLTGLIYIGKPTRKTESRPRPALADVVTYFKG